MPGERLERLRELKAQFDAAHREGMDALRTGDYSALDEAVQTEKTILEEQSELLKEEQAEVTELLKNRS